MVATNKTLTVLFKTLASTESGKREEISLQKHNDAIDAYDTAAKAIHANAVFIPKEFHDLFNELREKCSRQVRNYREFFQSGKSAKEKYDEREKQDDEIE